MPPTLDLDTAGGISPGRLERALSLQVHPLPLPRAYHVSGGAHHHWVHLGNPAIPACECGDYLWRGVPCAHVLAVLHHERDPRVEEAVRALVPSMRQQIDALEAVVRSFTIRLHPGLKRQVQTATGRTAETIAYVKSELTERPSVTVLAVEDGVITGEVLGVIHLDRPDSRFEPTSADSDPTAAAA